MSSEKIGAPKAFARLKRQTDGVDVWWDECHLGRPDTPDDVLRLVGIVMGNTRLHSTVHGFLRSDNKELYILIPSEWFGAGT